MASKLGPTANALYATCYVSEFLHLAGGSSCKVPRVVSRQEGLVLQGEGQRRVLPEPKTDARKCSARAMGAVQNNNGAVTCLKACCVMSFQRQLTRPNHFYTSRAFSHFGQVKAEVAIPSPLC